jgi:phosphoglycolate phosphatase
VVGSHLDGRRVEKSEVVAAALAGVAGVPTAHVAMIGDRRHDVEGARANGIDAIAVGWGYGSADELRRAEPTRLAESVDELGRLLLA